MEEAQVEFTSIRFDDPLQEHDRKKELNRVRLSVNAYVMVYQLFSLLLRIMSKWRTVNSSYQDYDYY